LYIEKKNKTQDSQKRVKKDQDFGIGKELFDDKKGIGTV